MPKHTIQFPGTRFPVQELPEGAALSEQLTVENSPILFGCRTGICGTCLISVEEAGSSQLTPADVAEREVLDMLASDEPKARLACQIRVNCSMSLRVLDEK